MSSQITDSTRIPLKLVITIVIFAVTLAGAAAVAQFQIRDTSKRVELLDTQGRDHDRRIQRSEDMWRDIRDSLREIKEDVKEIRRGGRGR